VGTTTETAGFGTTAQVSLRAVADTPDIALVSLGTTPGLRNADQAFIEMARHAGLSAELVNVGVGKSGSLRRHSALTDVVEARAARNAASGVKAGVVVYSTVTAALMQKPKGKYAVRFDSPAAENRPGASGAWSRRRESKVLAGADLLLPWGHAALKLIPPDANGVPVIPLHVPIEGGPDAERSASIAGTSERDIDVLAYAGYPEKRGLDVLINAWQNSGLHMTKRLRVTGIDRNRALEFLKKKKIAEPVGIEWSGLLEPGQFRYTLSRTRVFVNASRREDHGLSQLEALAAGSALVTVASEGPYEALPLATKLDARLVSPTVTPQSLALALRAGFQVDLDDYSRRATELLLPYRRDAIQEVFETRVLPALGLR
jgi:glycosyltransferase involved in cell wall biosynthesis